MGGFRRTAGDDGDATRSGRTRGLGSASAESGVGGQAAVEHVALVAFLVLVLGGATVAAGGLGAGVVNAVHSGIRRAICVAGGDRCAAFHDERPCVVRRGEQRQAKALTVAFLRIGARVGVVRERWSDGRTTVTVHDDVDAGATFGVGAELALGAGRSLDLSASVAGAVRGGWGRSWTFERPEDADRMIRRLLGNRGSPDALQGVGRGIDALVGDGLPLPDAEGILLGQERSARAAVRMPGVDVDAGLLGQVGGEALRDRRSGQLTVALGLAPDLLARLTGPMGLELGGRLAGDARAAVVLDRDLRPRELRLLGALRTEDGSRREQAELRVDLTRPQVGRSLRDLLAAVRAGSPRRAVGAATELGRWAAAEGAIERRTYRVVERNGARGGGLAVGAKLAYETTDAASEWRLERASTRPPGGVWETRVDCAPGTSS